MATFTVLDQAEEDKLHATRLLGIEERPFKRVSKRLLASTTPIHTFLTRPSPSAEDEDSADPAETPGSPSQNEAFLGSLSRFREDVMIDFAAFESSIARIQFLRAANSRERERYASEKLKIEQTANDVRENLSSLRVQLDEAQKTLSVRKTYDVLAEKITRDDKLRVTRAEQHVNIEKLKQEIEEAKAESGELESAWVDRREQFARVMGEGARLRRVIKDEKEPEAEGEKEGEDDEMERDGLSNANTPRMLEDAPTPLPRGGALTPRAHVGGATPRRADEDVEMDSTAPDSVPTENVVVAGDVDAGGDTMDTT